MSLFKQFRSGQDLGRGQRLRLATRVTLLEENPERYDRASLEALANRPFAFEEWLLITQEYLVYRTETAVLEHLRRTLVERARRLAPDIARGLLSFLAEAVDPAEETSVWLPLRGANARPWTFQGKAEALLGSKTVPFHYYEIEVGDGALYFLQQPVGLKQARRDFERISQALRSSRPI